MVFLQLVNDATVVQEQPRQYVNSSFLFPEEIALSFWTQACTLHYEPNGIGTPEHRNINGEPASDLKDLYSGSKVSNSSMTWNTQSHVVSEPNIPLIWSKYTQRNTLWLELEGSRMEP